MTDYLSAEVFEYVGEERRKSLFFVRNDGRNEKFTLTVDKPNGKGKYTVRQHLENIAKALDIHFNTDHERVVLTKQKKIKFFLHRYRLHNKKYQQQNSVHLIGITCIMIIKIHIQNAIKMAIEDVKELQIIIEKVRF